MKRAIRQTIMTGILAASLGNAFAQSAAGAFASATILRPLAVGSSQAAVLASDISMPIIKHQLLGGEGGNRFNRFFIGLPAVRQIPDATSFTIEGWVDGLYDISMPGTLLLLHEKGFESMLAVPAKDKFQETGVLYGGKRSVKISADLFIDGFLSPGKYQSQDFMITVNFN